MPKRRRLSDQEREIRKTPGINLKYVLPFVVMFIAAVVMAQDTDTLERCTGSALNGNGHGHGRTIAAVKLIAVAICSPYYLRASSAGLISLIFFWGAIPFALYSAVWLWRHNTYWDAFREREKVRRAARKAARIEAKSKKLDTDEQAP